MTTVDDFISADERAAVKKAVTAAEVHTRGEIVPYVVGRSDDYPEAGWRGAAVGALIGATLGAVAHEFVVVWGGTAVFVTLAAFVGAAAGFLLASRVETITRALVEDVDKDVRTGRRAREAFLEEAVYDTRERTGMLIFMSLFEHRAIVLADEGIHADVPAEEWRAIVDDLAAAAADGRPGDGLVEAVEHCGRLLREHGVDARDYDPNEAPNVLRQSDR